MTTGFFKTAQPLIDTNPRLRAPQKDGFAAVQAHFGINEEREVALILPVGCGKSGLISLMPFATQAKRTLVIAPGVKIAEQLHDGFDPTQDSMFYIKCQVVPGPDYPEPVLIHGRSVNKGDLEAADVVVTNIQQLQGENNRWLSGLPSDFFDLMLIDEAHHNVADSWERLRTTFPEARIINFSATPKRADGQLMSGQIIYTYPIFKAIAEGYVKRLKAQVLNPTTLRYVRRANDQEVEVSLEEVRRLGEEDSDFRRSIVTSKETLETIVDASILELHRIRQETGDSRHKIIASALNYEHCLQVVEAYRSKGKRAAFVHSREDSAANERILKRLEAHELDVIVQVRKLGEGFDHPYLSVAAVFSVFSDLSPFVQFVGRIMRVIKQNDPASPLNQGTVVFHAGSNIARRWADFQAFSEADQEFFDQLLPSEDLNFSDGRELTITPTPSGVASEMVRVLAQNQIMVEELPLLDRSDEARRAFDVLMSMGFTAEDYKQAAKLRRVPTTRVRVRQASQTALDERVKLVAGRLLGEQGLNPVGKELDKQHLGKTNFVVVKSAIDKKINAFLRVAPKQRGELTQSQLDTVEKNFERLVAEAAEEVFVAKA